MPHFNYTAVHYCPNITKEQEVFGSYSDVCATNPKKPNLTKVLSDKIDTGNTNPIEVKWRRIPYALEKDVHKQMNEMIRNEIVEPSYGTALYYYFERRITLRDMYSISGN